MTDETNGPGREPTRDEVVFAQHEETGRIWTGPRGAIPRRYHEIAAPPAVPAADADWYTREEFEALLNAAERYRDLIEQQARELAAARAALGAIDVRGPDGDGLVWIECAMPGVASGAVSIIGHSLAARVFVFWRDELLKPAQSVSTRETK